MTIQLRFENQRSLTVYSSVITNDHFRKTHIFNQNKPVSKHKELPGWLKTITFIFYKRYLNG